MDHLPTGNVTFLFTDIEGSTRLLQQLGTTPYAKALADHRRLLREAFHQYNGVEVDMQGDSFFVAFVRASDAVAAAQAAQASLADAAVRVRMGVHSGEPLLVAEGYVGPDVHLAARICAAAHGGQVVLSAAAVQRLVGAFELVNLGDHRLKDLAGPVRLYQLGRDHFPSLRSLYRTNLPVPATAFIGRADELAHLSQRLAEPATRMLTLLGPGGTGKTRLAQQAAAESAEHYPDGIWWVPLAATRGAELMLPAIAAAVDVKERPDQPLDETLRDWLAGKRILLALDNVEQLLPAAATLIADLLTAPGPTLLVTSRERIQLQREEVYQVPPLIEQDALTLFMARARVVSPAFADDGSVLDLCQRLDNLPLAIELAAARTVLFSPSQLVERLGQRLDLLRGTRDMDLRQQTLRAAIEWSHELLDEREQALFRKLSVFVGGWTYDAAEEIAGAEPEALQSLMDKSLVRRRDTDMGSRFSMLETIREYASERLAAAGEVRRLRDRHLEWLSEAVYESRQRARAYDAPTLAMLAQEQPNIRAALAHALDVGAAEPAQRLISGSWMYWMISGQLAEGDSWASSVAEIPGPPTLLQAWTVSIAAGFARFRGSWPRAVALYEVALTLLDSLDKDNPDVARVAAGLNADLNADISEPLSALKELDRARGHAQRALAIAEDLGSAGSVAHALAALAVVDERSDSLESAAQHWQRSIALMLEVGTADDVAEAQPQLANVLRKLGRLPEARSLLEQVLARKTISPDAFVQASALGVLGMVAADENRPVAALDLLTRAVAEARSGGLNLYAGEEVQAALAALQKREP